MITGRDEEFKATATFYYNKVLKRDPDPSGLQNAINMMQKGMTGPQFEAWLMESSEYKENQKKPPIIPSIPVGKANQRVLVDGLRFKTEDGKPWVWAMTDGFRDYDKFLTQGPESIRPVLKEAQELGSNGRRVLGMVDSFTHLYPQEHSDYYTKLPEFMALLSEYGQWCQFCIFADTKIIMPRIDDQLAHADKVWATLVGSPNAIGQLVNENNANQNGVDIGRFSKPSMTASCGSNGTGDDPPTFFWDYSDLGSERRGDFALSTTTVHYAINGYEGEHGAAGYPGTRRATVVSEPPGFAEDMQPGRRTNDPRIAYLMGLGTKWGAGGTAHSDDGIQSNLLRPVQKECVRQFLLGVKA